MNSFRHITPIEIRFADLDAMGHVNNSVYLTYIEMARVKYSDTVLGTNVDFSKDGFILARATVDFIVSIELHDKIHVATRCSRMGTKSFDLEYEIIKTNEGQPVVVAKGTTVCVGYNYAEKKSIVIPDEWKKRIEAYEK